MPAAPQGQVALPARASVADHAASYSAFQLVDRHPGGLEEGRQVAGLAGYGTKGLTNGIWSDSAADVSSLSAVKSLTVGVSASADARCTAS